ncbi:MAG: hypothetical protein Q7J48_11585, partial [Nocardioides sp.]|nr:hypothetical protein [Nocardioides sp.]
MDEEVWRPLGFEGDEAATYDALHDGVPEWMAESCWGWMRRQFVGRTSSNSEVIKVQLVRDVERVCRLELGNDVTSYTGSNDVTWRNIRFRINKVDAAFRVADYLLTLRNVTAPDTLDKVLHESGSAWKVGERAGKAALVRRVPQGVQDNADSVMATSGDAGLKLSQAWERAFGVNPDPTGAYALAVRAVEDAAIPVIVPKQSGATLGHVIGQLAKDGDWSLPLS